MQHTLMNIKHGCHIGNVTGKGFKQCWEVSTFPKFTNIQHTINNNFPEPQAFRFFCAWWSRLYEPWVIPWANSDTCPKLVIFHRWASQGNDLLKHGSIFAGRACNMVNYLTCSWKRHSMKKQQNRTLDKTSEKRFQNNKDSPNLSQH